MFQTRGVSEMENNSGDSSEPIPYSSQPIAAPMERWDAALSIVIGVFLIFMLPRIWQIMLGNSGGWSFSDPNGNPLPYTKTVYFPGDVAMALFSVALIVEGAVLLVRRTRPFLSICFAVTVLATLSNLAYVIYMMQAGYGFQMFSGLAVAIGVYIAGYEWSLLGRRSLR